MSNKIVDLIRRAWKRIGYEFNYPASSENLVVQDYLARKRAIVTRKNFFSPSQDEISALLELCIVVREDKTLNDKERDALLVIIAYPGWFPVER